MRRVVLCAVLTLAGCGAFGGGADKPAKHPGLEARLVPLGGSAVSGSALFTQRDNGIAMAVHAAGLPPGRYRVLIHERGNCSSPNGFSAGAPWSPAGTATPLYDRTPELRVSEDGHGEVTVRLSGIPMEGANGISGRAVIVHDNVNGPFTTEPGARNGRVGCGIIGPLRPGVL